MSLRLKVFVGYCIFVLLCGYFIGRIISQEIKPAVRQTTEETLVDTANLLAEVLRDPLQDGSLAQSQWPEYLKTYGSRNLDAEIWGIHKYTPSHRVYVTDDQGLVLLDSQGQFVGQDFSRWRDVALTLRGAYGARSSEEWVNGEWVSVMYVAAPIKTADRILGVVTVSKPSTTVAPYIARSQTRLGIFAGIIIIIGICGGGIFSWILGRELQRLREHAEALSQGQTTALKPNKLGSRELRYLGEALDAMRRELDGKNYIEQYVQSLTHELKTPLASIAASSELLTQAHHLSSAQQQQLAMLITHQTQRLQTTIDTILLLATLEANESICGTYVATEDLCVELQHSFGARLAAQDCVLQCHSELSELWGERELILMGLNNLLDNALAYATPSTTIRLRFAVSGPDHCQITLANTGPQIPDYALERVKERFYSLPRPNGGNKSTGLGLNFVCAIARRHGAELILNNTGDGVAVRLQHWPRKAPKD